MRGPPIGEQTHAWRVIHSSSNDKWRTPPDVFAPLHEEFNFVVDAAADAENSLCDVYCRDALGDAPWSSRSLKGAVWCNPPYGRRVGRWIQRAYQESQRSDRTVVCLTMASTETKWWSDWVWKASEVRLVVGRVYFLDADGMPRSACPKGSAIVVFDPGYAGPPRVSMWDRKSGTLK